MSTLIAAPAGRWAILRAADDFLAAPVVAYVLTTDADPEDEDAPPVIGAAALVADPRPGWADPFGGLVLVADLEPDAAGVIYAETADAAIAEYRRRHPPARPRLLEESA
jgi:hypothetical protein